MSQEQKDTALIYLEASRDAALKGNTDDFVRFLGLVLNKLEQMTSHEEREWKWKAMETTRMMMSEAEECIKNKET